MLDKIKVAGIDYDVVLKDLSTRNDDEIQLGFCIYSENKIEINDQVHVERQKQTLIHEMMHAIFQEAGIEDDEDIVNRLGLVLYQVLKDNDFSWLNI